MIERHYAAQLQRLLRQFPAVTVLGPRQSGKTTFIRRTLPEWTYLDLERPSDATPLAADPEARLNQLGERVVFDEAQRVPEFFPVLRSVIDSRRSRRGRFVLLGSASPSLIRAISESLAGRTAFLDLAPFRWDEVARQRNPGGLMTLWFRGGFPEAYLERDDRARWTWMEAYTRAFIERDLAALGIEVSAIQMRKLWTMLAHCNGGVWNASQLASSLGASYHTVNRYVDILEQTFLVRKLPPFSASIRKRLVKSPKVYFRDTGLLHYFLGIPDEPTLEVHPARGLSWEAFIIDQLISAFQRFAPGSQAFFWRTAQGEEVDLLMDVGGRRVPLEIRLHSAPTPQEAQGLRRCMQDLGLSRGYLIYPGSRNYSLGSNITAVSANSLLRRPQNVLRL
jgi:predicted AAA+ superfamily ATPase